MARAARHAEAAGSEAGKKAGVKPVVDSESRAWKNSPS
jgi:hypothetical protein